MTKMEEEYSVMEALYERLLEDNLNEAHITLDNIFKSKGNHVKAVVSMYQDVKPANEILEELHDWATENNMQEVLDKIQELSKE